MRKIIDSNQLQSESLKLYLLKSKTNKAILSDYAAFEAYKGNTLESIFKSTAIISEFPKQVIILKSTRQLCGINACTAGLQRRMIDKRQTKEFQAYIRNLRLAENGDTTYQQSLLCHGQEATSHLDRIKACVESTGNFYFHKSTQEFTKDERKYMRSNGLYNHNILSKIINFTLDLTIGILKAHPYFNNVHHHDEIPNTFIFRMSLCHYLLALDWGLHGGAESASSDRIRNDSIDMHFAALATFFDGVMSNDKKLLYIYGQACTILKSIQTNISHKN